MPKSRSGGGGGATAYYEISDFKEGMDLRKSVLTAPAGTMRLLQNAHITPGGEIEKRPAFVAWTTAPAGSVGLCSVNGLVYTHVPGGARLDPPNQNTLGTIPIPAGLVNRQNNSDVYQGKIFACFSGPAANYMFYDGAQVTNYPAGSGKPSFIRTYKEKIYGVTGRWLFFSAVGDPMTWQDPPPDPSGNVAHNGSGFIDIGSNDADSENLISMEVYYDKMSIFSSLGCQLWFLDPDPSLNQYYQTLRDAGAVAARSVRQYVANDVYFLGTHGIRSLRARDLSLTAAVADVGSPLDPLIQGLMGNPGQSWMSACISVLSPRSGRIWFVLPDRIYILSNFASPNISAWSVYVPQFPVTDAVYADPYVVLRDNQNNLYRFGSPGPMIFDSCPVTVQLPFLSFDKPATFKFFHGFDAICTNTWDIQASYDPTVTPSPIDDICTINGPTMLGGRIPMNGRSTHVQLTMKCSQPGAATFSKLFIHYSQSDTD